ncbi:anti-sigma factor antagonist [Amycolatopsis sp. OK19-0408]|uniref:Anti-sigma factor antagonist n=1 Tax=Amycolatopsis iheyensis TaxID=2945988 RepID=A0A9X2NLF2_9PSEU|nr:anti-sigma factor antagonist [Amycolatopsis iheyensis]MCR6488945.1 anti-sigma factor antagonist [Amycolatopsis iheyensis]
MTGDGMGPPPGPAQEQLLTLTVDEHDDAVVLTLTGEVDGLTAARLRDAVTWALAELDGRVLVLDLTAVGFLGAPGLRLLFDTAALAAMVPGYRTLRVVVDRNRPVPGPLEITGLDKVLALYHEVSDALAG